MVLLGEEEEEGLFSCRRGEVVVAAGELLLVFEEAVPGIWDYLISPSLERLSLGSATFPWESVTSPGFPPVTPTWQTLMGLSVLLVTSATRKL